MTNTRFELDPRETQYVRSLLDGKRSLSPEKEDH